MDAPDLNGYRRSATGHGFESVRVEGKVPEVLRGTLFRNGPALFEHGGRRHKHLFEGDGAVCAVRFADDEVTCAHRFVESEGLKRERTANKPLYGSAAAWGRRLKNGFKRQFKQTANTSVWHWQDRLFALMERGSPTELDARTLDTIGLTDLGGLVAAGFSAHPHRVHARKADYNFGLVPGRPPFIQLMEFPWQGTAREIGRIEMNDYVMLHDFIATENHLVFFIAPVKLQMVRAMTGCDDIEKLFKFDKSAGTEIVVVPLNQPSRQIRFSVDAFWQWHFAGAYEDGSMIVVDFVRHPDFGSLGELEKNERSALGRLTRAYLEPSSSRITMEQLWDHECEYPRLDPRFEGTQHRHVFVSYDAGQHILARVDTTNGKADSWLPPSSQFPSELVMVPRSSDAPEGDGYAMSLVYDECADESHIAVLDTARMGEGPVARVHLGHPVPMTFHGIWVAQDPPPSTNP